jgi:hypothetical protein
VCPVTVAGREPLASTSDDQTVRIREPAAGEQVRRMEATSTRSIACPVTVVGRDLPASASADGTVRIWDAATPASLLAVPVGYDANAIDRIADRLAIGLTADILVIGVTSRP